MAANTVVRRRDPATQSEGVVAGYAQTSQRWPSQPLVRRPQTRSELSGPQDLRRRLQPVRADLAGQGAKRALGQLIHLRARVVDEDGAYQTWLQGQSTFKQARARIIDRPKLALSGSDTVSTERVSE